MSEQKAMKGLTEGRIVHYVIPDGPKGGEHRPAMIVRIWDAHTGYVNLQVFFDGTNDGHAAQQPEWVTSVSYSKDTTQPRTWHWIEPA